MDAGNCPHCGGPNPVGASECQWCGSGLPLPSVPRLDFSRTPVFEEPLPEPEEEDDSRPLGSIIVRVIFVAIFLIIVGIGFSVSNQGSTSTTTSYPVTSGPDTVNVTQVAVNVPTDACGLSGITPGAFSVPAYTMYPLAWWLPWAGGSLPCSVSSVTTDTPGFNVTGNFPLSVTANQTPLMLNVETPAAYNGVLTLTVL